MKKITSLLLTAAAIALIFLKPLGDYSWGIGLIMAAIAGAIFKNQSYGSLNDLLHPIKTIKETFTPIEECRAESRKTLLGFAFLAGSVALIAIFRDSDNLTMFVIIAFFMMCVGAALSTAYISCLKRSNEKYLGK
jgi:hypothetical protein